MTHGDVCDENSSTVAIDIRVAPASPRDVLDAELIVDGVAAESPAVVVARVAVTPSHATPVFDAGIDPSATTDRSHDDSPMLPERPDHNDHHS